MTWAEFKKAVEAKGITDNMQVLYIDIRHDTEIEVETLEDGTFWVA